MSISGARPAIWSASTRAEPHDSAQPLEPCPRLSHRLGMPRPRQHAHAGHRAFGGAGRHPGQGAGVVHPQAHLLPARRQFARQAPAHAQVAVVVHDLAEDVPKQRWSRHAAIVPLRGHAPGVWRRFVHSGA